MWKYKIWIFFKNTLRASQSELWPNPLSQFKSVDKFENYIGITDDFYDRTQSLENLREVGTQYHLTARIYDIARFL